MSYENLYIIGNGFDRAHRMPTKYSDFKLWLSQSGRPDIILELQSAFPAQQEDEFLLWSEFEKALGLYDIGKVENWSWEDLYLTEYSIGSQIFGQPNFMLNTRLPDILNESFRKWVKSIPLPTASDFYELEKNAFYLTFNYTDTLEVAYSIPEENVLHIHGRASRNDNLIVGHNKEINLEDYWDDNLDMRENNERMQRLEDMNELRKPYCQIIERNKSFFRELDCIRDIYVIGHSCSEIDLPYFQKIAESVGPDTVWHFFPYCEEDILRIKRLMKMINVDICRTSGV